MSKWQDLEIGKAITFNPTEKLSIGQIAKKIPMDRLSVSDRKISGFEFSTYSAGPKFRNGDTLLAKITPCLENGKTAKVDILGDGEVAFGSSEFIVLRENEYTINDFIYYYAKSPAFRKRAISCMEGTSGRKRVNETTLKNHTLPIPDKETQRKIANVLNSLDSKIELNNRINAELEAMAKTVYDYWFVQFDFPFDFAQGKPSADGKPYKSSGGKMVWREELKREVPEGWEVGTLSNLYDFQYGSGNTNPDNGGQYPVYGSNGIIGGYDKYNSEDSPVIGHIGNNCGSLVFAVGKHFVTYNGVMCKIKDGYDKYFGFITLQNKNLKKHTRGSSQSFISYDILHSLNFILPDSKTMKIFCDLINPTFDKIILNQQENLRLSSLRDCLLPMLMNGQVKVGSGYEGEVESLMAAENEEGYGGK